MLISKIFRKIYKILRGFEFRLKANSCGKNFVIEKPLVITLPKYISVGNNVTIKKNARLECYDEYSGCSLKPKLIIGSNVWIGYGFTCLCSEECVIGEGALIASNVFISTENHGINPQLSYIKQPLLSKKVMIGAFSWLGEKVVVLPGVTIGEHCIVGAGAVVTKNMPAYSMVAGNPARVIKIYDFDKHKWLKCD